MLTYDEIDRLYEPEIIHDYQLPRDNSAGAGSDDFAPHELQMFVALKASDNDGYIVLALSSVRADEAPRIVYPNR